MLLRPPTNRHGSIRSVMNLIMLVEDDLDHAELIMRTIKEHPIPNQILHFRHGHSALDYLFRRNAFSDRERTPRPQIILLDIHLTDTDGVDILKTIKASDELKTIPVVMLTTSAAENDIARAYNQHANSYVVKPIEWTEFRELMNNLCSYWLISNRPPIIQDTAFQVPGQLDTCHSRMVE